MTMYGMNPPKENRNTPNFPRRQQAIVQAGIAKTSITP